MKLLRNALLSFFLGISVQSLSAQELKLLHSPNGDLQLTIRLTKEGSLSYSFMAGEKQFINNSLLGFGITSNKTIPSVGWKIKKPMQHSVNSTWKPVWGKRAVVPDQYNELIVDLTGPDPPVFSALRIEARAYNDGVAFRYSVPSDVINSSVPSSELTKYNFVGDYTAWFYNGEHENIGTEKLSDSSGKRLPVMTIKADKDAYLAIHEADLTTGDPLVLDSKKSETFFSVVSVPGKLEAGYHSAWRVILFGKTPGALIDSHLIELLNPQAKGDFSCVKPGVAVWDWRIDGAKTEGFI